MIKKKYLVVTNDSDIGLSIKNYFEDNHSTEIKYANAMSQALRYAIEDSCCLVMVDVQLLAIEKTEIVRIFRVIKHIPILALTDPLDAKEKIQLFHAGVNAFVEKPFNAGVCFAQAEALVELYLKSDDELSKFAPVSVGSSMVITPRYRQVLIDGKPLDLTRKEFDLLYFFAMHPGQVFSRGQLYKQVWDGLYELGGDESVKSYIKTLRKKLSVVNTRIIENIRGVGYRFIPPE